MSGLSARLFDAGGRDRLVELDDDIVRSLGPNHLLWVNIDRHDDDEMLARVARTLGLAEADLSRIGKDVGHARLTRTQDRLHLTVEALETDDSDPPRLIRREIDIVAAPGVVMTVHDGEIDTLRRFEEGLDGETRLGLLDAGDLLSSLVDVVFVGYFLVVEIIQREIDDLDQRALRGRRDDDVLGAIVELRRRIGLARRTLAPHRNALSTLALPEMRVEETIGQPWPGLMDRLEAAMGAVEGLRDGLLGTYDIHMGRVSQRANDVMRVLTLLSAVLLPSVVLAGIMGMNFKMPLFETTTNFWIVLGGMAGMALLILAVARLRRWL